MTLTEITAALKRAKVDDFYLRGAGWNAFMTLRKAFKPTDVKTAVWHDYRRGERSSHGRLLWDAPDMWKESTYDECVQWQYAQKTRALTVSLYDGHNMDGRREELRCAWTFEVDEYSTLFIKELLEPKVMWALMFTAADEFDRREDEKRAAAITAIMATYLKD
jgi:hypothetical protein